MGNSPPLDACSFVVDEKPYCLWVWDAPLAAREFLTGIDPDYYFHVVQAHLGSLDGEDRHYAALSIRLAYSQALETFFAFLGAAIQAPHCPAGWVLRYKNEDLRSVVQKLRDGSPVKSRLHVPLDWASLSNEIHQFELPDKDADQRIKLAFAKLWERFAEEFLAPRESDEYNAIKHGLRIQPGGTTLMVGAASEPGVPPTQEEMHPIKGSDYGSTSYRVEGLSQDKAFKHNFMLVRAAVNWSPIALAKRLELLAISIGNVLSYLKIRNGVEESAVTFRYATEEDYETPWALDHTLLSFEMRQGIPIKHISLRTKDAVLKSYEDSSDAALAGAE